MNAKPSRFGLPVGLPGAPAIAVGALMLALGACTPRAESAADPVSAEPPLPGGTPAASATGEAPPDLLTAIIDDLVEQHKLRREDIEVERAESVIWPDGALGCPEPGVMYTQAQVPGYWVVVRAGEKQYDYRASGKGHFRRCKTSFKIQLPVG